MKADTAASAGVISDPATATETVADAPETGSFSSIGEHLGLPPEIKEQLDALKPKTDNAPQGTSDAPQEEEPTETEPEGEPETEPDAEESTEDEDTETPKGFVRQEVFDKRIGKVTAQREEAREKAQELAEENEQLRSQLDGAQPVTVASTPQNPLAYVQTPEQLEQAVNEARLVRDFWRLHKDGVVENEGKENQRYIDAEEATLLLGQAEDIILIHAGKKANELRLRQISDDRAQVVYPEVFKRGTEENQIAVALFRQIPGLYQHPDRSMVVGDYLRGLRARVAEQNGASKTAHPDIPPALVRKTAPLAPVVPTVQRHEARPSKAKTEYDEAMKNLATTDDTSALVAAVAALRKKTDASKVNPRALVTA